MLFERATRRYHSMQEGNEGEPVGSLGDIVMVPPVREAKDRGVRLAVPRPGERIDVDDPPAVDGWWQAIA